MIMSKTKKVLSMLISTTVWMNSASHAQDINAKPKASQQQLVHIVMINMSGKSREAHVRDTVVPLPVAERVALQIPQGENIKITSSTDRTIDRVITAASTDEGRTIPVN
jgi:hypothetical protein